MRLQLRLDFDQIYVIMSITGGTFDFNPELSVFQSNRVSLDIFIVLCSRDVSHKEGECYYDLTHVGRPRTG